MNTNGRNVPLLISDWTNMLQLRNTPYAVSTKVIKVIVLHFRMRNTVIYYHYSVATTVEDGGLSWLMKSYQRMKEQSEREKRDLEEIVAERYGVSAERMIIVKIFVQERKNMKLLSELSINQCLK